jgi:hypothetical protein
MKNFLKRSAMALSVLPVSSALQAAPVYINEFHYDNQGSDKSEFVEIAGESGMNLQGWSLEFYNGGNNRRYMTWDLSGIFGDQQAGFGVLGFTGSGGIQNGGRDGIALIDNLGALVQFISYEGILTAENGSAIGHTSTDVGVFESPSTPLGTSIQLSGAADSSEDFAWALGDASFGEFNANQFYLEPSIVPNNPSNSLVSVSEPASLSLLGLGILMLGGVRKRLK